MFSSQREVIKDFSAAIALILIVLPHFMGWLSMAKLNSGRPGFPLYLLYTRPVRTSVLVAVPMAYLTAMPAAIYLVSALLLRVTSGYAFPLLPVAAWIAALNLVLAATNWSTRNRAIQMLGVMFATSAWLVLAIHRLTAVEIQGSFDWPPNLWPTLFDFPLTDYALIGAIGLASFGVAVASVARQRHGDAPAAMPRTVDSPDSRRLVNLFRFPCPTSSATRAQVWFEMKSSGVPVLAIGLVLAISNPLVFAITRPIDGCSPAGLRPVSGDVGDALRAVRADLRGQCLRYSLETGTCVRERVRGDPAVRNRSAGRPQSARKVGLRAARADRGRPECMGIPVIHLGRQRRQADRALRSGLRVIEGAVGALTGYQQFALAVVASIGVAVMVASVAAMQRSRHVIPVP